MRQRTKSYARELIDSGKLLVPEATKLATSSTLPADTAIDCIHRGNALRTEQCESCGGNVQVKVHGCKLHGECTLSLKDIGVRKCVGCTDRKAVAVTVTAESIPLDRVTACITHFKRPESLARLRASIERFYPDLQVLEEDTGGNLSAARNRLATLCPTPFYLMLEEDFVFTEQTRIESLLAVLGSNPAIGGASGATEEPAAPGTVGRGKLIWWDRDFRHLGDKIFLAAPRRERRTARGITYQPCDIVLNFGVFRRDMFRHIRWDESLPVQEHSDYFYRVYLDGQFHFAHIPGVCAVHFRDRPSAEYRAMRERDFTARLKEKHGATFVRDNLHPEQPIPNIVVLSIGRSNGGITTKMAAKMLQLSVGPDFDQVYGEHASVRQLNRRIWHDGEDLDRMTARRVLRAMPQPWIIKDPRFRRTLPQWVDVFGEFRPLLLYVTKDLRVVAESYRKKGWPFDPKDASRADRHFASWPWQKLHLRAEDIGTAAAMFAPERLKLTGDSVPPPNSVSVPYITELVERAASNIAIEINRLRDAIQ